MLNISVTLDFDDWMVGACFAALRREQEGGGFAGEGGDGHKPWARCCRPGPGIPSNLVFFRQPFPDSVMFWGMRENKQHLALPLPQPQLAGF